MNVGEMQRKLSLWAEREKSQKFFDLYHLLYDKDWLRLHRDFPTLRYTERYLKPNPYTTQEKIQREELPEATPAWTGYEPRPGIADLKPTILPRDSYRCQNCQGQVNLGTSHLDHIRPVRRFRRPVEANRLENLQTLCIPCHRIKTEADQQRESRVQ